MSYVGNTPTTQAFTPAIDYFSGNGSTTAFTLSRPVASVAQVQVTVNNVPQNPGSAFTVSGQTLTFTGTPSSGTNNIYVQYTSPITQVIQPGQGTVGATQLVAGAVGNTQLAAGAALANIGTGGVTSTYLGAGSVTTPKLSSGMVLKVQNFFNIGTSTVSATPVSLQTARFSYTPISTNSTLWLVHSAYTYMYPAAGYGAGGGYGSWKISEFNGSTDVGVSDYAYAFNYNYSTTYMQALGTQSTLQWYSPNTSLTPRLFGTVGNPNIGTFTTLAITYIYLTVIEVAN